MALYYLKVSLPNEPVPDDMIDTNVRIDYGKLRHLLVVNRQLNGNFDLLRQIIGEETAAGPVQSGFPLDRLDQRENFVSLLYFFGLLSMRGGAEGVPLTGSRWQPGSGQSALDAANAVSPLAACGG